MVSAADRRAGRCYTGRRTRPARNLGVRRPHEPADQSVRRVPSPATGARGVLVLQAPVAALRRAGKTARQRLSAVRRHRRRTAAPAAGVVQ